MPVLPKSAESVAAPRMIPVRQVFDSEHIEDAAATVRSTLSQGFVTEKVKPGDKVAVCVGSRGIASIALIVETVIKSLSALGAAVSIVPAMGSHGGGSVGGMLEVLAGYGITQASMGVPIVCTNDVTEIARLPDGVPVLISKDVLSFDHIVPVARVKPHTDFRGDIESGLCKMLAIGLGRHEGCTRLHREGLSEFPRLIPQVASAVIESLPVGFGVAIVENAYEQTCIIEAVDAPRFMEREKELLKIAKLRMPRLLFKEIDVLVVEQIGKDISGSGMDPGITGRAPNNHVDGYSGPNIKRIVALRLSSGAHGNAIGIGAADFTTEALEQEMSREATYANAIASNYPANASLPIVCPTEADAIIAAMWTAGKRNLDDVKIVRIKNTLQLSEIWITGNLLSEAKACSAIEVLET